MPSVLITQCLQRDFVGLLDPHDPLPNALHVGAEEALRLLGPDPEHGPLAHFMGWARREAARRGDDASGGAGTPPVLHLVHVRDAHDPDDPRQAAHLQLFGSHCLRGTPGAALVLDLEAGALPGEHLVDAVGLNDFSETRLPAVLDAIRATAPDEPLRVAVIGVWTEAKVTFLLYDLRTRFGVEELATSSALTASASRSGHFAATEQLRRLLGVRVFDGVGDLAAWLVPGGTAVEPPRLPAAALPALTARDPAAVPTGDDATLIGYLHRGVGRVELDALGGGFSGAAVYRAQAWDSFGHALAPSVVKVGPRALIARERVAFEQVEPILGNHAPTLRGYADLGERAAIRWAFASMGTGPVRTFKSLLEGGGAVPEATAVLDEVFEGIFGRFRAAASYERLPLLAYYQFEARWAPSVRARAASVAGIALDAATVPVPGQAPRPHPARFYEALGGTDGGAPSAEQPQGESHYVGWVHGDLNGANLIIDARSNVWVIDFFHAHRGHVLRDLAKLENDILYLMTPIADEAELVEHVRLTDQLRAVGDLRAPLPDEPRGVTTPALLRAWALVSRLRQLGAADVREDRDPQQLRLALLRYAVHTLSFDEASPLQKRAALAAAAGLAEDARVGFAQRRALRVDALPGLADGRLGLTLCPGRRDKGRSLSDDVATLAASGTTLFVTFVTDDELTWAGVPELPERLRAAGVRVVRQPIPDQRVPTLAEARAVVSTVLDELDRGGRVVLACLGGLGRSGLVAACCLVARGRTPEAAIAEVRAARDPRAVETRAQESFVASFSPG